MSSDRALLCDLLTYLEALDKGQAEILRRLSSGGEVAPTWDMPLAEVERAHILRTYEASGQNRRLTAERLGIGERTLRTKLAAYQQAKAS